MQFDGNAGIAGKTNEVIGCFTYDGYTYIPASANSNPANIWTDYALGTNTVLNPLAPVIYNIYPDGLEALRTDERADVRRAFVRQGIKTAEHLAATGWRDADQSRFLSATRTTAR